MKKLLRTGFVLVMIFTILLVIWYIPVSRSARSRIAEAADELETSIQREEKQRYEYNQVTDELPTVLAVLAEKQPLAEAAKSEIKALKSERNDLRAQKAELEASLNIGEEADQE